MDVETLCSENVRAGLVADFGTLHDKRVAATYVKSLVLEQELDTSGAKVATTHAGVRLKNAVIQGDLDLSFADIQRPIAFTSCTFDGRIFLRDATTRSVCFDACTFNQPVDARNLEVRFDFSAVEAIFNDWISLAGAEVRGNLDFQGATIVNKTAIPHLLPFVNDTAAKASLDADSIVINGNLYCSSMYNGKLFTARGEVRLIGARIDGSVSFSGAVLRRGQAESALAADGIVVGGDVLLMATRSDRPFRAKGEVRLLGARVTGDVSCIGARIANPKGIAVNADRISVSGGMFLRAFTDGACSRFVGGISLIGAEIHGSLDCSGALLLNAGRRALIADRSNIHGTIAFGRSFNTCRSEAKGEIRLLDSSVGGKLIFDGEFDNPKGYCVKADGLEVRGPIAIGNSGDTTMNGRLSFVAAVLKNRFRWHNVMGAHNVDLRHASAVIFDLKSPQNAENWQLNGFRYQSLEDPRSADDDAMLKFLTECDGRTYFPQPFRQVFRSLRDAGHNEEAIAVAVKMRRESLASERKRVVAERRRFWRLRLAVGSIWNGMLWLIGYGYRPWRSVFIAAVLWLIGTGIYSFVAFGPFPFRSLMGPAEGDLLVAMQSDPDHDWMKGGPPFISWMYALDRFMPVVDLGQASYYRPRGSTEHKFGNVEVGWVLTAYDWILVISGWVLSLLFAGSITGLMRRVDAD